MEGDLDIFDSHFKQENTKNKSNYDERWKLKKWKAKKNSIIVN
jgi:hypothetical protein